MYYGSVSCWPQSPRADPEVLPFDAHSGVASPSQAPLPSPVFSVGPISADLVSRLRHLARRQRKFPDLAGCQRLVWEERWASENPIALCSALRQADGDRARWVRAATGYNLGVHRAVCILELGLFFCHDSQSGLEAVPKLTPLRAEESTCTVHAQGSPAALEKEGGATM